jgi:hypothetical protein
MPKPPDSTQPKSANKEASLSDTDLAEAILALHLVIIAFNVLGLIVIPLGAWRGWRIVRIAWLRLLHLGLLAAVVAQAASGRACILTIWQSRLAGGGQTAPPLIMQWVDRLIYWNLPLWVFAIIYAAAFAYVAGLSILVPFGRRYRR